MDEVQPDRVVILATSSAKRSTLAFAGPAEDLARQIALEAEALIVAHEAGNSAGALLTLTGDDRKIPSLQIGAVPRPTKEEIWTDCRRGLMTAVGCGTALPFPTLPKRQPAPVAYSGFVSVNGSATGVNGVNAGGANYGTSGTGAVVDPFAAFSTGMAATATVPPATARDDESAACLRYDVMAPGRPLVRIESRQAQQGRTTTAMSPIPTTERPPLRAQNAASVQNGWHRPAPIPALDPLPPATQVYIPLERALIFSPDGAYPSTGIN
jgi:hypothetical protein